MAKVSKKIVEVKGTCPVHGEVGRDDVTDINYGGKPIHLCMKCVYEALWKLGVQRVNYEEHTRER